jgi:branched-chain amino acid transport system substrate-binding protein
LVLGYRRVRADDAEAVAKTVNDEGGVTVQGKRYNIQLVIQDGKSTLDGNTAAANKLVLDDKVQLVIGPGGFFNVATTPVFEAAKVLHVLTNTACQPGEIGSETPYAFVCNEPMAMYNGAIKALLQLYPDVKSIALAVGEDSATPYQLPALESMISRAGLTLVGDPVKFSPALEDFNPIAAKLHSNADEVDAYLLAMATPPNLAAITKGLRSLGDERPVAYPGFAPATVSMVGVEGANNIVNSGSFGYKAPGNSEVLDKIFELGGDTERQFLGLAPNGLYMLIQAIKAADSIEPDAVKVAWESMDSVQTIYGEGFPTGEQLYGLKNHAWVYPTCVTHIMDGSFEYVGWVLPDPVP